MKKFRGAMTFKYNNEGLYPEIKSTFEAIKKGLRTSTTRLESDGHLAYWKQVKVGDIITFYDGNGSEVDVEVTRPLKKLSTLGMSKSEWMMKECWNETFADTWLAKNYNQAWQMEYKLINKKENKNMKTIKYYDEIHSQYIAIEVEEEISNAIDLFDALEKEDEIAYWKATKSAKRPWYFKGCGNDDDYIQEVIDEFLADNNIEELQQMSEDSFKVLVEYLFPDIRLENMQDAAEVYKNRRFTWSETYINEFIPRSKSKDEILARVDEDDYIKDGLKAKKSRELNRMAPDDLFNEEALNLYGDCQVLKANALEVKRAAVSHNGDTEEDAEARRTYMGEYRKLAKMLERKYMKFKIADSTMDVFSYDMSTSHEVPRNEQYEDYFEHADWEWEKLMAFKESNKESYRSRTWSEGQKALAREKRLNDYRGLVNPPRFIRLDENDMIIRRKNYTKAEFEAGIKKLERQRIEDNCKSHYFNISVEDRADLDSWFKAMQVK